MQQCFSMACEIYSVPALQQQKTIGNLAERFSAGHLLHKRVRSLSLGERMRCELVAALLHNPKLLLLDEPTIGLDVVARTELRELLLSWQKEKGTTVLLTSHDLADVEKLCERCLVIDHGELVFNGSLNSLKGEAATLRRLRLFLNEIPLPNVLENLDCRVRVLKEESNEISPLFEFNTVDIPASEALAEVLGRCQDKIVDIQIEKISLEEVLSHRFKK